MVLKRIHDLEHLHAPLEFVDLPKPTPNAKEVLIRVHTCGVCHTELDEIEGRTPPPVFPMVLGHQVVGTIEETGAKTTLHQPGARVGVGWIHSACGKCQPCMSGLENLCNDFLATGRDRNGGYAEFMIIPETSAIPIPDSISDAEAAPMLCAGAIGYRSLKLADLTDGQVLGLMGFGASAHLVLKMVIYRFPESRVCVFARNGKERDFAMELGAFWSGDIDETPPEMLDAVIDTTPAWKPVLCGMELLKPSGRLVINAIRKEERDKSLLLKLDYEKHLWLEKEIKSVANVAREDIRDFLELAATIPIHPEIQEFPLIEANSALMELKNRKIRGAKVLRITQST